MYKELIGALKKCGYPGDVHYCRDCFLSDSGRTCHMKKLLSAAADAIEKLCSFIGAEDADRMEANPPKEE